MKKVSSGSDLGGAPFTKADLRTIFNDEIWDAIEAIFSPYSSDTEGLIISGCVISGAGPYDISEGIVLLDGEFMRLSAATSQTLPKYIAAAAAVNDSRTMGDGTTATVAVTKSAELVGSVPGAGQYIAITSTTDPDDRRWRYPVQSTTRLKTKVLEMGDWDMVATSSISVPHGVDFTKIRSINIIIRNDGGTIHYSGVISNGVDAYSSGVISSGVNVTRVAAGVFDSSNFDSTGYNRGWITITYED